MTPEQALALVEAFDAIPDKDKYRALRSLIARFENSQCTTSRIEPEWAQDCADRMQ